MLVTPTSRADRSNVSAVTLAKASRGEMSSHPQGDNPPAPNKTFYKIITVEVSPWFEIVCEQCWSYLMTLCHTAACSPR